MAFMSLSVGARNECLLSGHRQCGQYGCGQVGKLYLQCEQYGYGQEGKLYLQCGQYGCGQVGKLYLQCGQYGCGQVRKLYLQCGQYGCGQVGKLYLSANPPFTVVTKSTQTDKKLYYQQLIFRNWNVKRSNSLADAKCMPELQHLKCTYSAARPRNVQCLPELQHLKCTYSAARPRNVQDSLR